jgi:hypothetical protein
MYEHIRCNFLSSRYLLAWLVLLNLWVVALLCVIDLPDHPYWIWLLRVMVLCGLAGHTFYIIRRDYLLNHATSVTACLYSKGVWQLVMGNGDKIEVTPHGDTLVWYELTVLGFILPNGRKRFITIFPDTCDKNTQRQLRVELRLISRARQNKGSVLEKIKSWCIGLMHTDH